EPARTVFEPAIPRPYYQSTGFRTRLDQLDPGVRLHHEVLRGLDRRNPRSGAEVFTNSDFTRSAIHRLFGLSAFVNYPGVDLDVFRPVDLGTGGFVLSVGALQPSKGFDFLVRSLATIQAADRPPL